MYVSLSIYRLNQDKLGGAWCPRNTIQKGIKEWIQIDLQRSHIITGIVTQVCTGSALSNKQLHLLAITRTDKDKSITQDQV